MSTARSLLCGAQSSSRGCFAILVCWRALCARCRSCLRRASVCLAVTCDAGHRAEPDNLAGAAAILAACTHHNLVVPLYRASPCAVTSHRHRVPQRMGARALSEPLSSRRRRGRATGIPHVQTGHATAVGLVRAPTHARTHARLHARSRAYTRDFPGAGHPSRVAKIPLFCPTCRSNTPSPPRQVF